MKKKWLDRTTLAISVLALTDIAGWLLYARQRADEHRIQERATANAVIKVFLEPLRFTLDRTREFHAILTRDSEFSRLEYAPDYLQQHFASRPPNDIRRLAWKQIIEGIMDENKAAMRLIQENIGSIRTPAFRQVCDSLASHVKLWQYAWAAVLRIEPVPDSLHRRDLLAPRFPQGMDSLLLVEIDAWRIIAKK